MPASSFGAFFEQDHPHLARVHFAVVGCKLVLPEFGNGAGHLHAGRPSAHHHDREQTFPAGTGFFGEGLLHVFEQACCGCSSPREGF
jgi:hypothetical protein